MRVKRRTLASKREEGRLYVLLEHDPTTDPHRPHDRGYDRTNELIDTLREQLEAERQAHAEARRLLAAALERIPPQIEAPESSESEAGPTTTPTEPRGGAQEGAQRRPWWRRVFGG